MDLKKWLEGLLEAKAKVEEDIDNIDLPATVNLLLGYISTAEFILKQNENENINREKMCPICRKRKLYNTVSEK